MKKIILLSLFLLPAVITNAQQPKKTTREIIQDTLCKCITKKVAALTEEKADIEKVIMECFISDGMELLMKYAEEKGIDMTDQAAMEKVGKDIGIELTIKCPVVMRMAVKYAQEEKGKNEGEKMGDISYKDKLLPPQEIIVGEETIGIITSVNTSTFPASIQVKRIDGTSKKIYVVAEFYTSDDRFYNLAYMPGKKVSIRHKKEKIFIPAQKKFEEMDVLFNLTAE